MNNNSLNLIRRRLAEINGIKLSDEKKVNHEQLVPGAKEADFDKKLTDLGAAIDRTMAAHDIRPTKPQTPNTTASSEKSNSQIPGAKGADFDKKLTDLGAAIDRTMAGLDIRPTKPQAPNTTASSEKSNSQTTNSSQLAGTTVASKTFR